MDEDERGKPTKGYEVGTPAESFGAQVIAGTQLGVNVQLLKY